VAVEVTVSRSRSADVALVGSGLSGCRRWAMDLQSTRVWRTLLPAVNHLLRAWLRSGCHRPVSSSMMVLTFEGVRSGRIYSFPVGYGGDPEGLMTFTWFSWWKNFREERPVSLRLRGREVRGIAVAVRDPEAVAERFAYYLRRNPHDGRYFGVGVGRDGRRTLGSLPAPPAAWS
jgi:hypothetical protein